MYLLDTNVVSELRKVRSGKADPNVARWADSVDVSTLHLSVVTIQELETGVLLMIRKDAAQGAGLRDWLDHQVRPAFERRIIPIDMAIALRSAALHVPAPRPARDAMIAATALVHGLIVVSRDTRDFEPMQVRQIDPWQT